MNPPDLLTPELKKELAEYEATKKITESGPIRTTFKYEFIMEERLKKLGIERPVTPEIHGVTEF